VLALALGGSLVPGLQAQVTGFEVLPVLEGRASWPEKGLTLLVSLPEASERPGSEIPVSEPIAVRLPEKAAAGWQVTCRRDGVWCPTLELGAEPRPTLPVFPLAVFGAELVAPRGEILPEDFQVVVEGWLRLSESRPPFHFIISASAVRGRLSWEGPAQVQDLRFSAKGWVPLYRWDVAVEKSRVAVGRLPLARGGSVCGFVNDARTGRPVEAIEVRLRPAIDPQAVLPPAEEARLQRFERTATTNARGFFQVAGVPVGGYRVDLMDPDGRLAPHTLQPVEVRTGSETCFPQVLLSPFLTLTVVVDPAHDPEGLPWRVEVLPLPPEVGEAIHREATLPDGEAEVRGLPPKSYLVQVLSAAGQRLTAQEHALTDDLTLPITLDLVEIDGRVTLGDEGLAATLEIETGQQDKVALEANEEGYFTGWVRYPEHRILFVTVEADEPPIRRRIELLEPRVRDGVIRLRLQLGDRALRGRVETEDGEPVPKAEITVRGPDGQSRAYRADSDAGFDLRGLEEGPHQVSASHPDHGRSPWTAVEPQPEGSAEEVALVLKPDEELAVEVYSADGQPVQGARVTLLVSGPFSRPVVGFTDVQGRVSLGIQGIPSRAVIQVAASSHMLWAGCVSPEPDGYRIQLPSGPAATARLVTRSSADRPPPTGGQAMLFTDTAGFFTASDLSEWQMLTTGSFGGEVVERLAPGRYARAWVTAPWWELATQLCTLGPRTGLSWEALPPGGVADLTLDVRAAQR